MTKERLTLFDTTLRDGAQTTGVDFSLDDKRHIASMLDGLGLDYIEGGYPGANPADTAFFAERPKFAHARFAAFGMVKRAGRSVENDPGLAGLFEADADAITFVAKAWDYHVRVALGSTLEENLDADHGSRSRRRARGAAKSFSIASISSTASRAIAAYALSVAEAAFESGARWIVLCDTNGGTLPHEVERIVGGRAKPRARRPAWHPRA